MVWFLHPILRVTLTLAWLALVAFLIAHLGSLMVSEALGGKLGPTPRVVSLERTPSLPPARLVPLILQSPVFPGDKELVIPNSPLVPNVPGSSFVPRPINLKLVGTVAGNGSLGFAILKDPKSSQQTLYRLGEVIPNIGKLVAIDRHAVTVSFGNGQETKIEADWLKQGFGIGRKLPASGKSASRNRKIVDRREVAEAFSNIPKLLSQVQAVPVFSKTGMQGVTLMAIKSDSIFDRLGFQKGDLLKTINGVSIGDPGTLLTALRRVKDEPRVNLEIERNNKPLTLAYEIR